MTYLAIESEARRLTVDEIESVSGDEIPEYSPGLVQPSTPP